jgi:hypothetical protein
MTNPDNFPDLSKHLDDHPTNQSNQANQPSKFPSDDSNVGDNPIYPDEDDLVPVNDLDTEIDDEFESDEEEETLIDQKLPVEPDTDEPDTDIPLTRNPNPPNDIDDQDNLDEVDSSKE